MEHNSSKDYSFESTRLLHAYIVIGPEGEQRERFANMLACAMLCEGTGAVPCGTCKTCRKSLKGIHPDLITVRKPEDKATFSVELAREVRSDTVILPNEANKKVYILEQADSMNDQAQNALLKTLEEPPGYCCFILTVEDSASLLATIRSRCAELHIPENEKVLSAESLAQAKALLSAINRGELETALFFGDFEGKKLQRDDFNDFLSSCKALSIEAAADGSISLQRLNAMTEAFETALNYSARNVNIMHITGMLCARLTALPDRNTK